MRKKGNGGPTYVSKISNAKWIVCDLPGNAGWILFLAGLFLCWKRRPEIVGHPVVFALLLLDGFCGAAMLCGIGELISERMQGLDRVLPRVRLYRGFGALTFGGLAGLLISLPALAVALLSGMEGAAYLAMLCGGGLLCFVFGGLILAEYRNEEGLG